MTNRGALDLYESVRYNLTHPRHKEAVDVAFAALVQKETVTNSNGLTGWISVEDRLPLAFVPILICHRKGVGAIVEQGYRDIDGRWKVHGTRTGGITHWMPLPEAPKEDV